MFSENPNGKSYVLIQMEVAGMMCQTSEIGCKIVNVYEKNAKRF